MAQIGIPAEELLKHTTAIKGFTVLDIDLLFALKLYALAARGRTPRGRKDFLDVLSLFVSQKCNISTINENLKKHNLINAVENFKQFLGEANEVKELSLHAHKFSKIKKILLNLE